MTEKEKIRAEILEAIKEAVRAEFHLVSILRNPDDVALFKRGFDAGFDAGVRISEGIK